MNQDVAGRSARLVRTVLALSPATLLAEARRSLEAADVPAAVARGETAPVYDWLMTLVPLQGVSDRIALAYAAEHGHARHADLAAALDEGPACPRLASYWHYAGCGYRKAACTCAEPGLLPRCPVPRLPLRKGLLNQAAYSLYLFLRDVCGGDLVGWLDARLADADPGPGDPERAVVMGAAVLTPLREIHGVSGKLLSMALADLLLAADPGRERWTTAGAGMIAVDSLVHNWLARTGLIARLGCPHPLGPACYAPGGCAAVIRELARGIDARAYDPSFPREFPRFVQHAIWAFGAEGELDLCNGRRIDDRRGCRQAHCPAYRICERRGLRAA